MQDLEQAIRERAYHLWVADGCRDENANEHWLSAQREVLAAPLGSFARVKDTQDASTNETKQTRKAKPKSKRRAA